MWTTIFIIALALSQCALLVSQIQTVRLVGRWMKEHQEMRREQLNILERITRPSNISRYPDNS